MHSSLALYFNTNKPHSFSFLQNTSCIRKPQVISGGGGVRTPCTLPLDPPLLVASLCCFLIFLLFLFSEVSMLDFCFTYISSSFYFFNEEMLRKNNGKRSSFTEVMQYYLLVARKKNPSRIFCSWGLLQNRQIVTRCHFKKAKKKIPRQCTKKDNSLKFLL